MKDKNDKLDHKKEKDKPNTDMDRPDKDREKKCAPTEESARADLMGKFAVQLAVLRAAVKLSQAEISQAVGISRQTYLAMENQARPLTWSTFLALFAFFYANESSRSCMDRRFLHEVMSLLNVKSDQDPQNKDKPKENPEQ